MNVIWKVINDFTNYEVSSNGDIRNIKSGKTLKKRKNKDGYEIVNLVADGKTITKYVHRLVAEAFCDNPNGEPTVNHLDECKQNNVSSNLQFCSHSYNKNYSTTDNSTITQYNLNGEPVATYVDMNEIISKYPNYNRTNINMNLNAWTKTAYGFVWRYDKREY